MTNMLVLPLVFNNLADCYYPLFLLYPPMKFSGFRGLSLFLSFCLLGCSPSAPAPRLLNLHQSWPLSVGTKIAGYPISSGLGDVSLDINGDVVHMPFNGTVEPTAANCIVVSSADVPAYLLRLCGLSQVKLGARQKDQPIGRAQHLVFAMLRREPDGTWAVVEPSPKFIEQLLVAKS